MVKMKIPRRKRPVKMPVISTRGSASASCAPRHQAQGDTFNGILRGLRISEVAHLKVSDIDSARMTVFIRQVRGKKDRYTILSKRPCVTLAPVS